MSLHDHHIKLSNLREGEEILHNCTSHWLIHLREPLLFIFSLLLPFIAVYFLVSAEVVTETKSISFLLFFFSLYALCMSVYFMIRGVNFELGRCVITNQRVLRLGYKGLSQIVERDILPNKIEDVKVVRRGGLSLFFNVADIEIYTSNNVIERLKNVLDPRIIQNVFSDLRALSAKKSSTKTPDSSSQQSHQGSDWIDDAFDQREREVFDVNQYRQDMIGEIGDVFSDKEDNKGGNNESSV